MTVRARDAFINEPGDQGAWLDVAKVEDIAPNDCVTLDLADETAVAVFKVNNEFFAIEDICSHDGEPLSGGPIVQHEVVCPRHGARFCLKTGKALCPPAYYNIRTFPTRVRNGRVEVSPKANRPQRI